MSAPHPFLPATGRAATARRVLATTMAGALLTAGLSAAGTLAAAAPALADAPSTTTVGAGPVVTSKVIAATTTPAAPSMLFREDFELNQNNTAIGLTDYVGGSPYFEHYTASSTFLDRTACNGVILDSLAAAATDGCANYAGLRTLAQVLGQVRGLTGDAAANNHAVAAYTDHPMTADQVEFQTVTPLVLTAANRFLSFSVDAAEVNCSQNHAQLKFYLQNGATDVPTFTTPIDPCTDSRATSYNSGSVKAGTFYADKPVLFSGSSVGIKLVNGQGNYIGNDAAFDNIQILDATPSLSTSFSAPTILAGQTSTATFTVTNTSELAVKTGFGFADALPAGLTVAATPRATTTCGAGSVSAASDSITLADGVLAAGKTSCTVTVDVTASNVGSYVLAANDFAGNLTGLNQPTQDAALQVDPGTITLSAVLTGNRVQPDEQFFIAIDSGEGIVGHGETAGSAAYVDSGSGTTGATPVTPGQTYTLLGDIGGRSYLNTRITCLDSNADTDGQTGLPSGETFTGSRTVTPVVGAVISCAVSLVPNAPALSLTRTPTTATVAAVGDPVPYTFTATNTGNVPLTSVSVTDSQRPSSPTAGVDGPLPPAFCQSLANPAGSCSGTTTGLAAGQVATFTATYNTVQSDLDRSGRTDTATASGTDPASVVVRTPAAVAVVTATGNPALTLTNLQSPANPLAGLGDTVTTLVTATNTGNLTLNNVVITDLQAVPDPEGPPVPAGCQTAAGATLVDSTDGFTLAPGASRPVTVTHTLSQADLDCGSFSSVASATGEELPLLSSAPLSIPIATHPQLTISQTPGEVPFGTVGGSHLATFLVTNTGDVTMTRVGIQGLVVSGSAPAALTAHFLVLGCDGLGGTRVLCPRGSASNVTLAAGQSHTFTVPYVTTQAELDAGSLLVAATAYGTPPAGDPVSSAPARGLVPAAQVTTLTVTVARTGTVVPITTVGQSVATSFLITNTGNVTMHNVGISAAVCPASTLAPGSSETCTSTYRVTQADLDNGAVLLMGRAVGTTVLSLQAAATASAQSLVVVQRPSLTVTRTGSYANGAVSWTDVVTNTGNTTLLGVTVTDPTAGPVTCPTTRLLPGTSVTCTTAPLLVTAAQTAARTVTGTATVTARTVTGATVSQAVLTTVSVPAGTAAPLPLTGLAATALGKLAAGLLVLGMALVLLARRRRLS